MVTIKVIDASAFGAVLFNEPEAQIVIARLHNSHLAAPALFPFEIASICLKKIRRYPEQRNLLYAAYRMADHVEIEYPSIKMDGVIELADKTGLTVYDASYLYLAQTLGAELVTLDKQLLEVQRSGFEV